MMRNAQPGERCRVTPRRSASEQRRIVGGKEVGYWDFTKGNSGTVRRVIYFTERGSPSIYVEPDPEFGHGECWFWASELERIKEDAGDDSE